ncbi:uncharacterized protein [Dysidea avara]|uniref:uncharacterized protein n=1 Tax=Dysidea avara TaxID=196820 RepID=UPI00331FDADE
MAWLTLFFIVILSTVCKVTPLHCSDQQLPASGDDGLQQVTTLQYCLVDNCTIMMIDTGEKLDIVYTTDNIIVTTPTDGHISMVIAKLEKELPCEMTTDNQQVPIIVILMAPTLMILVSGYTAAIHIMLKKLRNKIFGKLLMFYSLVVVCLCLVLVALLVAHYSLAPNSQVACHGITVIYLLAYLCEALFATCLLHHVAYLMYRSYKLKPEMSKKTSKHFYMRYIAYVLGTTLLSGFLIILYDVVTGNGRNTILLSGHCAIPTFQTYDPLVFISAASFTNKIVQVVIFITYLYYKYKVTKLMIIHGTGVSGKLNRKLHKITIAVGATIGLSHFGYLLQLMVGVNIQPLLNGMFLIQQCVIMACFLGTCTKKVQQLYREYYLKN